MTKIFKKISCLLFLLTSTTAIVIPLTSCTNTPIFDQIILTNNGSLNLRTTEGITAKSEVFSVVCCNKNKIIQSNDYHWVIEGGQDFLMIQDNQLVIKDNATSLFERVCISVESNDGTIKSNKIHFQIEIGVKIDSHFIWEENNDNITLTNYTGDGQLIILPDEFNNKKITMIDSSAFYNNTNVKAIDLSQCGQLQNIGSFAFKNCINLETIDISGCNNLTKIGDDAFSQTKIKEIILPSDENSEFNKTFEFKATDIPKPYQDGLLYTGGYLMPKIVKIDDIEYPANIDNCKVVASLAFGEINIPNVQDIVPNGFSDCSSITKINFSDCTSLKRIGINAFAECKGLTEIDLSQLVHLAIIDENAFGGCENIKKINLSGCSGLLKLNTHSFANCIELEMVDFTGCNWLQNIDGGGDGAFLNCNNLIFAYAPKDIDLLEFRNDMRAAGANDNIIVIHKSE